MADVYWRYDDDIDAIHVCNTTYPNPDPDGRPYDWELIEDEMSRSNLLIFDYCTRSLVDGRYEYYHNDANGYFWFNWKPGMFMSKCLNETLPEERFKFDETIETSLGWYPGLFEDCQNLKRVDFTNWDLTGFRPADSWSIGRMFVCDTPGVVSSLEYINMGNITDYFTDFDCSLEDIFKNCESLKTVDISGLDGSKVSNMRFAFSGCHSLENVIMGDFDPYNVTTLEYAFFNCTSLVKLDLSKWHTSNCSSFYSIFDSSYKLEEVDIRNFTFEGVSDFHSSYPTFCSCVKLRNIVVKPDTDWFEDFFNSPYYSPENEAIILNYPIFDENFLLPNYVDGDIDTENIMNANTGPTGYFTPGYEWVECEVWLKDQGFWVKQEVYC